MHGVIPYNWQVQGIKVAGSSAPVSQMDFCAFTLNLAVGSECGLVRYLSLSIPFFTFYFYCADCLSTSVYRFEFII